jgi:hypothetical protein
MVTQDGEVAFDPAVYLRSLGGNAMATQKQLMAAYDAACQSLIGPNDVQKEGNREFKKKSAWRKLARYFGISIHCERGDAVIQRFEDGSWVATARAEAIAPWGQRATDVGACGSDEQTGRRTITMADALATAMTRATNRAISNLIAMGEVSAEEIGDRKPYADSRQSAPRQQANKSQGEPTMPFGKTKGTPLSRMDTQDLSGALDWARSKGKFEEFQQDAEAELNRRQHGAASVGSLDDMPEGLQDDDPEALPF